MPDVNPAPSIVESAGSDLLELIGETPLVELERLNPNPRVNLLAKLEGHNPSGSVKDRVALSMIEAAERDGELKEGMNLLEPSSGNTAIALAMIGNLKGYDLTVVMPANVSEERRRILRAFGAELIESPADRGTNGAVFKARELAADTDRYVMLDQYANEANPAAHYHGTGREIVEATEGVDAFVAGLGTGGTLMGAGRRLREAYPEVRIVGVQPEPQEDLSGLRNLEDGFIPEIIERDRLDGRELVRNREAFEHVQTLLEEESLFVGISSGAAVAKALKHARRLESGTVVTVLPDGGWKYLSMELWTRSVDELEGSVTGPLW